jgi:predicted GNAT superfamily acetyltransferase/predicted GIY-YIG superfamily endonuclease
MAGVHPSYQGQGIGFQLKQLQREWARENGYNQIRWTFDPLQRGNANFNIHKLGTTANCYCINYYGEMNDGINAGLPSDRLEVNWQVKRKPRVSAQPKSVDEPAIWLRADPNNQPQICAANFELPAGYVEIPADIGQIKRANPEAALAWRLALREVLETGFRRGYTITDFRLSNGRWFYHLTAPQPWWMYVVECADQTLYTGITPHIEQRIRQHNSGKGAVYTAARRPVKLLASWRYVDRSAALRAEAAFKKLSRPAKLAQIISQATYRGGAFVKTR